jgi:hypothetical protein
MFSRVDPYFSAATRSGFCGQTATIVVWIGSAISFLAWVLLLAKTEWGITIVLSGHYLAAMFYFLVYRPVVYEKVNEN